MVGTNRIYSIKERLENSKEITSDGCWEWTKSCFESGYGQIKINGKNCRVHRVSYEVYVEPLEHDKIICHKCNNRKCFNPDHLYQGTHKDNYADQIDAGTAYFQTLDQYGTNNHRAVLSREETENIQKKYLSGKYSQQELAEMYSCSRKTIGRCVSGETRYLESTVNRHTIKEVFYGKTLSDYGVFKILDLLSLDLSVKEICSELGVSRRQVQSIKSGVRHKNLIAQYKSRA